MRIAKVDDIDNFLSTLKPRLKQIDPTITAWISYWAVNECVEVAVTRDVVNSAQIEFVYDGDGMWLYDASEGILRTIHEEVCRTILYTLNEKEVTPKSKKLIRVCTPKVGDTLVLERKDSARQYHVKVIVDPNFFFKNDDECDDQDGYTCLDDTGKVFYKWFHTITDLIESLSNRYDVYIEEVEE